MSTSIIIPQTSGLTVMKLVENSLPNSVVYQGKVWAGNLHKNMKHLVDLFVKFWKALCQDTRSTQEKRNVCIMFLRVIHTICSPSW